VTGPAGVAERLGTGCRRRACGRGAAVRVRLMIPLAVAGPFRGRGAAVRVGP